MVTLAHVIILLLQICQCYNKMMIFRQRKKNRDIASFRKKNHDIFMLPYL
jgi:hypothetical protein